MSHLFTYGELTIPGVGKLWIKKIPAKRVLQEARIYGPTIMVDFKEDTTIKSTPLTGILANKHGWSMAMAEEKIREAGTKIINDLLNFGESHLYRFGAFKTDNRGDFSFEMDEQLQKSLRLAYPDLPLQLLPVDLKKPASSVPAHSFEPVYERRTKIGWFFPFLALLATSLLLACIITCFIQKRFQKSFVPVIITKEQPEGKTKAPAASDSFGIDKDFNRNGVINWDEQNPEDFDPIDDSLENTDDLFEESSMGAGPYDSLSDYENESYGYLSFKQVESLSLDAMLQLSAKKRLSFSQPCMIVVGSYMRRDLINNMIERLVEMDYEVYVEKFGSFYRTAIIYECASVDARSFLQEIRQRIEPKAWILEY